ncbi:MAG: sigma-70 family RNA polymerase sigma factor [Bryobacterales bacterium]|nr:sigma-70 family RNA polymerase sigma factor [Bryobacterales bacterium]
MSSLSMSWWFRSKSRKPATASKGEPVTGASATSDGELDGLATPGPEAVAAIYQRHGRSVYRFAYALTASREAAEETTQEVFLFLLREWKRYDPAKGTLEAWILGITRHLARKHCASGRLLPLDADESGDGLAPGATSGILETLLHREQRLQLHGAIAELPEAYREALVLHALQGLPYERVAEQLGCPLGTVRSRIARAKEMLVRRLRASSPVLPVPNNSPATSSTLEFEDVPAQKGAPNAS